MDIIYIKKDSNYEYLNKENAVINIECYSSEKDRTQHNAYSAAKGT